MSLQDLPEVGTVCTYHDPKTTDRIRCHNPLDCDLVPAVRLDRVEDLLRPLLADLDERATTYYEAHNDGLKKHAAQNWGSYVAFELAAGKIRELLGGD